MKYYIKLGLILFVTCAIATGILAYLNGLTAPMIKEVKDKEAQEAQLEVTKIDENDANSYTFQPKFLQLDIKGDSLYYYVAYNQDQDKVGYVLTASKYGYSGNVKTVVGLNKEFKIKKIKVIDQAETPGLGAKCVNPDFAPRFTGLGLDELKVDKDGGTIKSITGATITTRTISNSIKESLQLLMEKEAK
ncbi:RnfABCDGE type electron transport complex subunit G [bacterium]|nr:RnfABCDGE type electron transport complex subunit G [bacterium]